MTRTDHRFGRPSASVAWLALLAAVLTALLAGPAIAQDEAETPPPVEAAPVVEPDARLISPAETLVTFDEAMDIFLPDKKDDAAWNLAKLTCDFSKLDLKPAQIDAANNLFRIMSRIEFTSRDLIPDPGQGDSFIYFPRPGDERHAMLSQKVGEATIELVRNVIGEWRISAATIAASDTMWIVFKPLPIVTGQIDVTTSVGQNVRDRVPAWLLARFLTLAYWQWIAILLMIFVGVVIDFSVRSFLSSLWHRMERKRGGETDKEKLRKAMRPFGMVAAAAFWMAMINLGGITGLALTVLLGAIRVFMTVGAVWAAWRLTDLVADFFAKKAEKTANTYDDLLIPLFQRALKIFIGAIGLIYLIKALGQDPLPLLTGLGIGGLAVAFAAKDTIENFFGSVAVIIDQPFEVGDWIIVNDVEGTVEELGFRSTRIRTFYNSLVTVPNAMLVRATVDNMGRRQYRRFSTMLNLTYDTSADKIEAFCEGIREIIRLHPYTRKDYFHVYLNSFGAHSLDVMVYMFFECDDWAIELREKQRFMLDILRLADTMGVGFAFPTQTLEIKQLDPGATHTPAPAPGSSAENDALREGITTARLLTKQQPWHAAKPGPVLFGAQRQDDTTEYRGDGGE